MGKKLLIALMLSSFLLAGPAMAVKKVPKSGDQQSSQPAEERQRPPDYKQAPAAPAKATPPSQRPERQGSGKKDIPRARRPDQPSPGVSRDRFIDRDGDGINDNLKKPPETIKRKRDSERPPKAAERPQQREPEKPQKDRRSR